MNSEKLVLLAEDDPNDVFLLERAFTDAGVNNPLVAVQDGQEAIDYLAGEGKFADRTKHPLPYLIILDLKMPRKTGIDVLLWLKQNSEMRLLPTIVFSSSAQPSDIDAAYDAGANAFLVKPSGTRQRVELVRTLRSFWLELNEPPTGSERMGA